MKMLSQKVEKFWSALAITVVFLKVIFYGPRIHSNYTDNILGNF